MWYPPALCLHLSGKKALKLLFQISRLFRSSCHLQQPHSAMPKWFSTSVSFSFSPALPPSLPSSSATLAPVPLHCVPCRPSLRSLLFFPFTCFEVHEKNSNKLCILWVCNHLSETPGIFILFYFILQLKVPYPTHFYILLFLPGLQCCNQLFIC